MVLKEWQCQKKGITSACAHQVIEIVYCNYVEMITMHFGKQLTCDVHACTVHFAWVLLVTVILFVRIFIVRFRYLATSPSSFVPVILLYSEVTYYHYQSKHSLSTGLNYTFTWLLHIKRSVRLFKIISVYRHLKGNCSSHIFMAVHLIWETVMIVSIADY